MPWPRVNVTVSSSSHGERIWSQAAGAIQILYFIHARLTLLELSLKYLTVSNIRTIANVNLAVTPRLT